jgi:hypothetical protein
MDFLQKMLLFRNLGKLELTTIYGECLEEIDPLVIIEENSDQVNIPLLK